MIFLQQTLQPLDMIHQITLPSEVNQPRYKNQNGDDYLLRSYTRSL
jgi:hypothetical protein